MFQCSYCLQKTDLIVCSKCNTISCSLCYEEKCNICNNDVYYNIHNEIIDDIEMNFVLLNNINIGFSGFDRIDSNLMEIIKSIDQIDESLENDKIILFPNKIESIKFAQKFDDNYYREEDEYYKKSKYGILVSHDITYYLLNFENVKSNEISFLIKLLILERLNPDATYFTYKSRYTNILFNSLKIYNKRLGINHVSFTSFDETIAKIFFKNNYKDFHSHLAYKKLLEQYPLNLLDYLQHKIEIDHSIFQERTIFNTDNLIELYARVLGLKLIEKSVKNNSSIQKNISIKINEKIEYYFSIINNSNVKSLFDVFILNIEKTNLDDYENYLLFIEKSLNDIFNSIPFIFIRYWEVMDKSEEAMNLISQTQSMMIENPYMKIIPNISDLFKFVFELDRILSHKIPFQYRIVLLQNKFVILNEIIVLSRDKTFFDKLLDTNNEFESLLLQNYDELKKDEMLTFDYCDLLINYGNIALIYYMFHDIKNTREVLNKRRRYLNLYPVPELYKIGMIFANFQFFEDYSDLKEIHKLCMSYTQDEEDDFYGDTIKVICKFACFFIGKNKMNFFEIIELINNQKIIPQSFIKNIIELEASEIFMGIFYHIINATKQDSIILLVSEVEKALKLAELQNEQNEEVYPYDYYLLKTRAIVEILNENIGEVKNIALKLDNYDLESKEDFKNAIIYWLDTNLVNYRKNIEILLKLDDVDDPWCNLIYKIIREKISQSSYYEAKSELEEVKKIKDTNDQLIKFKQIVERNCINAFWESRIRGKLMPQPEKIGTSLFVTFLQAGEFYNYVGTENEEGVGRCDVLTVSKNGTKNIFELKIVKSKKDIEKGIEELIYYLSKEDLEEGYLILFDARKLHHKIENKIIRGNKKLNILLMKIYEVAPSKT